MSYLNQAQDPRRRTLALTGTIAVHVALGIAVVTGLTIAGYKPIPIYDPPKFPLPPPPKPDPAPTPTASTDPSALATPTPPLPLPLPPQPGPTQSPGNPTGSGDGIPLADPLPIHQPDPPRPTPSFTPRPAAPSNDKARWITNDDYPARALRDEAEGTVGYRLIVGSNGRVSACEVTRSSGNSLLDQASCRLIERRARFDAATDRTGARVVGSYSGTVRWEIPD